MDDKSDYEQKLAKVEDISNEKKKKKKKKKCKASRDNNYIFAAANVLPDGRSNEKIRRLNRQSRENPVRRRKSDVGGNFSKSRLFFSFSFCKL